MRAGTTAQELSAPGKNADPSSSPAGPTSLSFAPTLRIGGIGRDAKEMPVLAQALITASLSSDPRPTCVVLPDTAHMAALVAVLVSIERLPSDFIAQAEDYMDRVLVEGSRVLSIPEGYVYEVGTRNDLRGPGRYLHYLDAKNQRSGGRTVVTAAELLAFEPTERKRPLGRPDIKPCKPAPPSYDTICNVETYGNTSLIRNRVIVIGSQADFERFAEGVRIVAGADRDPRGALADDFPWGVVTETGRLAVVSPRSGLGNPLVALTRDPLLLRELCTTKGTEKGSRIVLTDNVDLTMRSLDLVERNGEAQRFMLLAPARRREDVAVLRSRGWLVWEPQPWELRAMDSAPGGRRHRPPDRDLASRQGGVRDSRHYRLDGSLAVAEIRTTLRRDPLYVLQPPDQV